MAWGVFASGAQSLAAARALRAQGHARLAAFTPYPIPALEEELGLKRPRLLLCLVLLAAFVGGGTAFLIMWWTSAIDYPLNVGGRPLNSFITDIPIMFESAVLAAATTAFFATLFLSGMPRLHHDLDSVAGFERTSIDRFWIGVELEADTEEAALASLFRQLGALETRASERAA
jgi:ActD protein